MKTLDHCLVCSHVFESLALSLVGRGVTRGGFYGFKSPHQVQSQVLSACCLWIQAEALSSCFRAMPACLPAYSPG